MSVYFFYSTRRSSVPERDRAAFALHAVVSQGTSQFRSALVENLDLCLQSLVHLAYLVQDLGTVSLDCLRPLLDVFQALRLTLDFEDRLVQNFKVRELFLSHFGLPN